MCLYYAFNKIDQSGEQAKIVYHRPRQPERVYVSAHTSQGLNYLRQAVHECLMGNIKAELSLKPAYRKFRTQFYALNVIQSEHYDDHPDLKLHVIMAPHKLEQLIKQARTT